jgi:hypothetical protein
MDRYQKTSMSEPPEGMVWLTVELSREDFNGLACVEVWDLDQVEVKMGPDPKSRLEKALDLLEVAALRWNEATAAFSIGGNIGDSWLKARDASQAQEQAARALSVYLKEAE